MIHLSFHFCEEKDKFFNMAGEINFGGKHKNHLFKPSLK